MIESLIYLQAMVAMTRFEQSLEIAFCLERHTVRESIKVFYARSNFSLAKMYLSHQCRRHFKSVQNIYLWCIPWLIRVSVFIFLL